MIKDYLNNVNNYRLIRYVGFSMAVVGMLVGIATAVVAICTGFGGLGGCAAGMLLLSFVLFPVTDLNFPKRGYY